MASPVDAADASQGDRVHSELAARGWRAGVSEEPLQVGNYACFEESQLAYDAAHDTVHGRFMQSIENIYSTPPPQGGEAMACAGHALALPTLGSDERQTGQVDEALHAARPLPCTSDIPGPSYTLPVSSVRQGLAQEHVSTPWQHTLERTSEFDMRAPQQLSTPWGHTLSSRYSDSQATVTEEPECDQSQHNDSATSEGSHTVDDSTDSNSDTASGPDEPDLGRSTRPRRGLLMGQVLDKLRPKERVPDGPRAPCAVAHRSSIGVAVNKRPAGIARTTGARKAALGGSNVMRDLKRGARPGRGLRLTRVLQELRSRKRGPYRQPAPKGKAHGPVAPANTQPSDDTREQHSESTDALESPSESEDTTDTATEPHEPLLERSERPGRGLLMGQVLGALKPRDRSSNRPRASRLVAPRPGLKAGVAVPSESEDNNTDTESEPHAPDLSRAERPGRGLRLAQALKDLRPHRKRVLHGPPAPQAMAPRPKPVAPVKAKPSARHTRPLLVHRPLVSVYWHRNIDMWQARVRVGRASIHIGSYKEESQATDIKHAAMYLLHCRAGSLECPAPYFPLSTEEGQGLARSTLGPKRVARVLAQLSRTRQAKTRPGPKTPMPEAALPGATHPLPSPAIPHHSEATLIETPIQPSTDALRDPVCAVGLGSMAPGAPASQVMARMLRPQVPGKMPPTPGSTTRHIFTALTTSPTTPPAIAPATGTDTPVRRVIMRRPATQQYQYKAGTQQLQLQPRDFAVVAGTPLASTIAADTAGTLSGSKRVADVGHVESPHKRCKAHGGPRRSDSSLSWHTV